MVRRRVRRGGSSHLEGMVVGVVIVEIAVTVRVGVGGTWEAAREVAGEVH